MYRPDETLEDHLSWMLMKDGCTVNKKAIRNLANYIVDGQSSMIKAAEEHLEEMSKRVESRRPREVGPREIDD